MIKVTLYLSESRTCVDALKRLHGLANVIVKRGDIIGIDPTLSDDERCQIVTHYHPHGGPTLNKRGLQ